jgi:hypothetical protein
VTIGRGVQLGVNPSRPRIHNLNLASQQSPHCWRGGACVEYVCRSLYNILLSSGGVRGCMLDPSGSVTTIPGSVAIACCQASELACCQVQGWAECSAHAYICAVQGSHQLTWEFTVIDLNS